jgi:hypothetical protein
MLIGTKDTEGDSPLAQCLVPPTELDSTRLECQGTVVL